MIDNEKPVIANSLWTATANPAPDCPPFAGPAETEVAIVGGGFTGLSAALHLAEAGVPVTLLEAETPGWGASGRNGGQVNPGLKENPDEVEARFGAETGGRMVRMSGAAGDVVFDLVARHGIACDAVRAGWLFPATNEAGLRAARDRSAQWERRGQPVHMLSRAEMAERLGSDFYLGGLVDERGGTVHPLNYALGLAAAAQRAGALLHGRSRVTGLDATGADYTLTTAGGRLRARRVILATNGYTDGLFPGLARAVVPLRSVQVATVPLGDNVRRAILPHGHHASDSRWLLKYYRTDAAGRFIMGGRGSESDAGTLAEMEHLRRAAKELYPVLGDVEWEYAWGGYVAMTADHYPHLTRLHPGVVAALGYNGRGVAMASAMGKVLAQWATGTPEAALDFPVTPLRPIPFHGLRGPAVAATIGWYRLRDRLGI